MKESYAEIVEDMGVSCTGVLKDGGTEYIVTYNPAYRTTIDKKGLERLKINHPDVYDGYVNTTESRRFAVKRREPLNEEGRFSLYLFTVVCTGKV